MQYEKEKKNYCSMNTNSPGTRYKTRLCCWSCLLKAGECSMHLKPNKIRVYICCGFMTKGGKDNIL